MRLLNIIVFMLLCCGCRSERNSSATEASLEDAVDAGGKVFATGDADAIADLFIPSEKQAREQLVEFAESITKSDSPLNFKFESCKVSGNMGIVLLSFSREKSYYPYFAKWEDSQWKFYLDFLAWQDRRETRKLDLTESEMEDALVLQKWASSQPYVGASGLSAHDRLGWYVPHVPKDLKIEAFYESPSPAMDHDYMWKIKIAESIEFVKFAEQFLKPPPNVDGKNDCNEVSVFDTHPDWWKAIKFEEHKVYQYRVEVVGSNGGEKGYLCALFDRDAGYLYVQAF